MNIAMTPDQFQQNALAWIAVAVTVIGAISTALAVILPKLTAAMTAIDELKARQDRQKATSDAQQAQITQVALAVPPTGKESLQVQPQPTDQPKTP